MSSELHPLPLGSSLPALELKNTDGTLVQLTDFKAENGNVIAFIHGTWCPACLRQLVNLNLIQPELEALGVGLVCITKNTPAEIEDYRQNFGGMLRYPLVADGSPSAAHQFGVFDDYEEHESPYPSLFFAGADNVVLYVNTAEFPDCEIHMDALLALIKQHLAKEQS